MKIFKHISRPNKKGRIGMLFAFFAILLLSACYRDKGSYSYTTLNDIAISYADTFYVPQGTILSIQPSLTSPSGHIDTANLSYEWLIRVAIGTADSNDVLISTNLNLNNTINYPAGTSYPLNLRITDKTTGVTYRKQSTLNVTTDLQPGFFVVEKSGGKADMSFINTSTGKLTKSFFSERNPTNPLPATADNVYILEIPKFTYTAVTTGGTTSFTELATTMCLVTYGNGGYVFDYRSGVVISSYEALFDNPPAVVKPQFFIVDWQSNIVCINNGAMYRMLQYYGQKSFADSVQPSDGISSILAPFEGGSYTQPQYPMYYDMKNYRFLRENVIRELWLYPMTQASINQTPNPLEHRKLLTFQNGYNTYTSNALFKDLENGNTYNYRFSGGDPLTTPIIQLPSTTIVDKSPQYIFSDTKYQMYYSDGANNLYLYDITANTSRLFHAFPAGETIKDFQFIKDFNNLGIATNSASGGKIYTVGLTTTGDESAGTLISFSGFDEIIKIGYKKQ